MNTHDKLVDLVYLLDFYRIDIALITETWLSPLFDDYFCSLFGGFRVLSRNDRKNAPHGGIIAICRKNCELAFLDLHIGLDYDFATAFLIRINSTRIAIFILCYLPPVSSPYNVPFDSFKEFCVKNIKQATHMYTPEVCTLTLSIMGDFNFPNTHWSTMNSPTCPEMVFVDYFGSQGLSAHITSGKSHFHGNILDNTVSNDDNIHGLSIKDRTGLSDHLPIFLNYCNALNKSCDGEFFQYSFSNYQHHINFETTWRSFNFNNYPWGENVDDFCSFLAWSFDTCFPRKRKIRTVSPFYYSSHTIHCLNKLNTANESVQKTLASEPAAA